MGIDYVAGLVRSAMQTLPKGRKPRIRYPEYLKTKGRDILLAGAYANRTNVTGLLERMSFIRNPVLFQVFDKDYQDENELSIKDLRHMNNKVWSHVTYKFSE